MHKPHRPDITRKTVLKYLKSEANSHKIVRVSLRDIAKALGCSHVTAKMKIDELAALGYIKTESQNRKRTIITISKKKFMTMHQGDNMENSNV